MAVATTRDEGNTVRADGERPAGPDSGSASRPRKALTIGAVAKILSQEFDDISISKIRYLEDQKLLAPRRTAGGYRLYSQADVERLRTILRLQRDEFLPLRVIRQELNSGADLAGGDRRAASTVAGAAAGGLVAGGSFSARPAASSCRITRRGRNSSRWRRRIVRSRSTSAAA